MKSQAVLTFLVAVGFCASGCSQEKEVVLWLRKSPRQFTGISADAAEDLLEKERGWRPVQHYESWDEWVLAGQRITGCEEVLLGFCKEEEGKSGFSKWFIVQALGCVESHKSVPLLLAILGDENEDALTRSYAAFALGHIGSHEAVGPLSELVKGLKWSDKAFGEESDDGSDRSTLKFNTIVALLEMIDDPQVRPILEAELHDPGLPPYLRQLVEEGLAKPQGEVRPSP